MRLLSCPDFIFNGISGGEMGIKRVFEKNHTYPLSSAKNILSAKPMESDRRIISRTEGEPVSFSFMLSPIDEAFTDELINNIYKWLSVEDYAKLYPDSQSGFYYLAIPFSSQSDIELFARKRGYFEVEFLCDSPHGYIDAVKTANIGSGSTQTISFENNGGVMANGSDLVPLFVSAALSGSGSITISSSACEGVFSAENIPGSITRMDIDGASFAVFTDNDGIDAYKLVHNAEALRIYSDAPTNITVSASDGISCVLTAAAAIPRMA